MVTEQFGRHTVTFYESVDELPIDRFTAWNRYMMLDNSLGSTFEDIDRIHLSQLAAVIDDKQKAIQQIVNLRQLVYGVIQGVNYNHHAYACLVHSIDGQDCSDFSDSGVKRTIKWLSDIGVTDGSVKKKMNIARKFSTKFWKIYSRISSAGRGNTSTTKR